MLKFLIRRLAQSVLVFFVFLTLAFFLIEAQPGSVADRLLMNPNLPPEARAMEIERLGLDRPITERYFIYLGNFFQGELGVSELEGGRSVASVIAERFPRTITLFLTATIISFYLGFIVGKFIAWRRNGFIEYASTIGGVYLFTIFTPWFSLLLLWLFAFQLGWFPLGKFVTPEIWLGSGMDIDTIFAFLFLNFLVVSVLGIVLFLLLRKFRAKWGGTILLTTMVGLTTLSIALWFFTGAGMFVWDIVSHMVLPVLVLTLISFAGTMLLTRNSMLETIREDYVMVARAKGLPANTIRDKYVSRNAILPVITSLVLSLALAIDGGVITESVFSWEGLGLTLLRAATQSDVFLAMGAFLFIGLFALIAHVVVDILYAFLDPRIRLE